MIQEGGSLVPSSAAFYFPPVDSQRPLKSHKQGLNARRSLPVVYSQKLVFRGTF